MTYFHEIPPEELHQLVIDGKDWGYVNEHYLKPDWCDIDGIHECKSLVHGDRTLITRENCSQCHYIKK